MKNQSFPRLMSLFVAVVFFIGGVSVFGQGRIVGSISGAVADPNGAAGPNATVMLKENKTGLTKQAATTHKGPYFFPHLAIGAHKITASANGFRKTLITNLL